jgi:inositol transport system substrate-binding protein
MKGSMLRKFGLVLGTVMAISAVFSSAVALAADEKIAISFHNLSQAYVAFMNRAASAAAKDLGVSLMVMDAQGSSPKQSSDLANALVQGAQGIVIFPNDAKAVSSAIDDVMAENIPIVSVDTRIVGTAKPVPYVTADNVAGGRKMAGWVIRNYPDGARIVHLTGTPGMGSAIDRAKGVRDGLAASGAKYVIIGEQTANWMRAEGLSVTESILTANTANPPNVIVADNDDMALGALEAINTVGLRNAGIKVIGFDAVPEALRMIRSGEMAASVEQSPSNQIRAALQTVVENVRNGKEIKPVSIEPFLITKDNLDRADRYAEMN